MAIILDEDNKVVTVENQPDAPRAMFKNLPEASTIESGVGDVLINGVSIVDEHGNANIPQASTDQQGVVSVNGDGLQVISSGRLRVSSPTSARLKEGTRLYQPVDINHQHEAMFYGMAKAAGDTTQALSDNEVGNYTAEAKAAIRKMLGVDEAELITEYQTEANLDELVITTDLAGATFKLRTAKIIIIFPASTTGASSNIGVYCIDADTNQEYSFGIQTLPASGNAVVSCKYQSFGAFFNIGSSRATGIGNSATAIIDVPYTVASKAIRAIRIAKTGASDTQIPAGTHIFFYGIRE